MAATDFRTFKPNTRFYAEYRLASGGKPHPAEHFTITERLDRWWADLSDEERAGGNAR
jgi:hypothetical protein